MNSTDQKVTTDPAAGDTEDRFQWVRACGGPEITTEDGHRVTGLPEVGWHLFDRSWGACPGTSLNLHTPHEAGLILIALEKGTTGCAWDATYNIGDRYPAQASGLCDGFWEAYQAAKAWRPEAIQIGGFEFWKSTDARCTMWEGGLITIIQSGEYFNWQHDLPTEMKELMDMVGGSSRLNGQGFASLEDAAVDALGAPERLRNVAAEIVFSSQVERDLWTAFRLGMQHGAMITKTSTPGEAV